MPDVQVKLTEFSDIIDNYTTDFVGRGWLAQQVNELLSAPDCRFVVLTGGAGVGKSAFMAHLAATHPQRPRYFIRRDSWQLLRPGDAKTFLLTIGGQLAALYPQLFKPENLEIIVRQRIGDLEADAQAIGVHIDELHISPFYRVAMQVEQEIERVAGIATGLEIGRLVSDPRNLGMQDLLYMGLIDPAWLFYRDNPKTQIVVLVDALDELRFKPVEGKSVLDALCELPVVTDLTDEKQPALPNQTLTGIPPNIRFIVTSRKEKFLDQLLMRADAQELPLEMDGDNNKQDLRFYLQKNLPKKGLEKALDQIESTTDKFKGDLLRKANGNFLYLRSILDALEKALADPKRETDLLSSLLRVDALPDELDQLYDYFIDKIVNTIISPQFGQSAWREYLRPFLGTLAIAQEPLNETQLEVFTGLSSEDISDLQRELRQFVEPVGSQPLFHIYHASFAEYLLDEKSNQDYMIDGAKWHGRIADHYWDQYHADWSKLEDVYGLRYLITHLIGAKRTEDLHKLLRLERQVGERRENVWYTTIAATGDTGGYAADILKALQTTHSFVQIGMHMRYILILSSLNSLASNLPLGLLEALISAGIWTPAQAISMANQTSDPDQRARALTLIAPHLSDRQKTDVVNEIIATSKMVKKDSEYLLAWLAPKIVELGFEEEALQLSQSINTTTEFVEALTGIAVHLSNASRDKIIEFATQGAMHIGELFRGAYLEKLIPLLSESLLSEVLIKTQEMENAVFRGSILALLIPRLAEAWMWDDALELATSIENKFSRTEALARLLPFQSDLNRSNMLEDILDSIYSSNDDAWRSAIEQAVVSYNKILWGGFKFILAKQSWRVEILKIIMPYLTRSALRDAWDLVITSSDSVFVVLGIEALFDNLSSIPINDRLTTALQVVRKIGDLEWRVKGLATLISYVSEAQRSTFIAGILNEIGGMTSSFDKAESLSAIAPHLPETAMLEVLNEVRYLDNRGNKDKVLNALAPHLPASLLQDALVVAQEIGELNPRVLAIASVAPGLTEEMLQKAVAATRYIEDEYVRARALVALAPYLPNPLLDEALDLARSIEGKSSRAEVALPGLAICYQEPAKTMLLFEAIAVAASMNDPERAAWAFEALPDELPKPFVDVMLQTAQVFAQRQAKQSDKAFAYTRILASVVPRLAEPDKSSVIRETLARIPEIEEESWQGHILAILTAEFSYELFSEAVKIVGQMASAYQKATTYGSLLSDAPPDIRSILVSRIENELQYFEKTEYSTVDEQVMRAISYILPYNNDIEGSLKIVQGFDDYTWDQRWKRIALVKLAPLLTQDHYVKALNLARDIDNDNDRAQTLLALAKHSQDKALKDTLLQDAFEAALSAGADHPRYEDMTPIIEELIRTLSKTTLRQLWMKILPMLGDLPRSELLKTLVSVSPLIIQIFENKDVQEIFDAIQDTARWWP
ncbi:ATP-binding protein [Chloroflexota bacterium]